MNTRGTKHGLSLNTNDKFGASDAPLETAEESSAFDIPLPESVLRKQDAGQTPFRRTCPEAAASIGLKPMNRQQMQQLSENLSREAPRYSGGLGSGARRISLEVLHIQTDTLERVYEHIDRYFASECSPEIELSPIADDSPSPSQSAIKHPSYFKRSTETSSIHSPGICASADDSTSDESCDEDWMRAYQDADPHGDDSLCLEELLGLNAPPFCVFGPEDSVFALPTECQDP